MLLIGQKSGFVYGIDPDHRGEILWKIQIGKGGSLGGIMWGMAADSEKVYVPMSDYMPGPAGGMFALKIATGEKAWYTPPARSACKGKQGCSAAQMAPATLIPGVVFSGSMDGHLRAYSTSDGSVIWDLDTLHDFETVNGVKAHGGSMNATGPTIAGGMMFVIPATASSVEWVEMFCSLSRSTASNVPAMPEQRSRIASVDALRGFVMIVMALDHVRDFFHISAMSFSPDDLSRTTTALFLTRWITHFCAPVFMFTAGMSAFFWLSRGHTKGQLSRFLWTRGLWLVFLELSVVRLGFNFSISFRPDIPNILWALGWSMVILSALIHLPIRVLAPFSIAVIALHNLADSVNAGQFGGFAWMWNVAASVRNDSREWRDRAVGLSAGSLVRCHGGGLLLRTNFPSAAFRAQALDDPHRPWFDARVPGDSMDQSFTAIRSRGPQSFQE